MNPDLYSGPGHIRALTKPPFSPPWDEAPKRPGAVKGAPFGAAKQTLDGEDRFEMIQKGEKSATIPGAESRTITGKYRGPLPTPQLTNQLLHRIPINIRQPHLPTLIRISQLRMIHPK